MRGVRRFQKLVGLALIAVFLFACATTQSRPIVIPSPQLLSQVRAYLAASEEEAEKLLPELTRHPIAELEAALGVVLAEAPTASPPTGMIPHKAVLIGNRRADVSLYVPTTYDSSRAYPLVICLHGAGFGGEAYLERWAPRLGEDFILACPTIAGGAWWTKEAEALVLAVIDAARAEYRIDPDRIILTGMSNGGIGTYLIGLNHPDLFAALVPMASVLPPALFPLLDNASQLPFYIIHGAKDQVMPVTYSRQVVEYLKRNGSAVTYREHNQTHPMAGGHFFPKDELSDLVTWLKKQTRTPAPRNLAIVRDRDHTGRAHWIEIDEIADSVGSFWASETSPAESKKLQDGAYAKVTASINGNTIRVKTDRIRRFSILIGRNLINLDRPIRVEVNGKVQFEGDLTPDPATLLQESRRKRDPDRIILVKSPIHTESALTR